MSKICNNNKWFTANYRKVMHMERLVNSANQAAMSVMEQHNGRITETSEISHTLKDIFFGDGLSGTLLPLEEEGIIEWGESDEGRFITFTPKGRARFLHLLCLHVYEFIKEFAASAPPELRNESKDLTAFAVYDICREAGVEGETAVRDVVFVLRMRGLVDPRIRIRGSNRWYAVEKEGSIPLQMVVYLLESGRLDELDEDDVPWRTHIIRALNGYVEWL